MTDPTQYENSEHLVPEKKYGKEKQHIWQRVATDMKLPNLSELCEEITLEQTPEYLDRFINGKVVGRYVVNLQS